MKLPLPSSLTLDLHGEGMTAMHRAGLGGLYMTLVALDRAGRPKVPPDFDWELGATRVTLRWTGDAEPGFTWLLGAGLATDGGLIDFPGLAFDGTPPTPQHRLVVQEALMGTFLQHGKSRMMGEGLRAMILDPDAQTPPDSYRPLDRLVRHADAEALLGILDGGTTELVGWYLPGAVEKHPSKAATRMQASAAQYLALLFAPVGAIPFAVRNQLTGRRQAFALVIPEVDDLEEYAEARASVHALRPGEFTVASAGDAALRVAASAQLRRRLEHGFQCTLVAFGVQPWASQQKTRTWARTLDPPEPVVLRNYQRLTRLFPPQPRLPSKTGGTWQPTSAARGAIATSLVEGLPWWQRLIDAFRDSQEFRAALNFQSERRGIAKMVQEAEMDATERLFVEACHAAMRTLYASIGDITKEAGEDFAAKVDRELGRVRASLLRAKNADSLRDALLEFWSRAGRKRVTQNAVLKARSADASPGWQQILPLLSDKHWRKARDLALLALISYPGREAEVVEQAEPATPSDSNS